MSPCSRHKRAGPTRSELVANLEIDFLRSEDGPTSCSIANGLRHAEAFAGQADQPLILALVVPMREKHRQESKRIEVLARGSTFLSINRVELEEPQPLVSSVVIAEAGCLRSTATHSNSLCSE